MKCYINIHKLQKEMYYHPGWYKDKNTFLKLLYQTSFNNKDICQFGRLYIKYHHLHCLYSPELTKYFNFMLQRTDLINNKYLFNKTKNIYKTISN